MYIRMLGSDGELPPLQAWIM